MIGTLVFYALAAVLFLSLLAGTVISPFVAYRYRTVLDRWLPAALVLLAGAMMIASGIVGDRDLQYASLGHVINERESLGQSRWISRIANLTVIALCVPHLVAKLAAFLSRGQKISWSVVAALAFGLTSFILPGFLGTKAMFDHHMIYPILVMLVVLLGSESGVQTGLRLVKLMLLAFLVVSLLFLPIDPSRVLAPGYKGFIPGLGSRFWGLASHPNAIGPIATLCIFLEFFAASKWRIGRYLTIAIALAVLVLAQSKTSMGATLVGLVAILYFRRGNDPAPLPRPGAWSLSRSQALLLLGGIAFSLALLLGSLSGDLDRVAAKLASNEVTSFSGRDQIWATAYREWQQNPWFGYGTDLWNYEYRRRIGMGFAYNAHNQVLQTLSESGLFGLGGLVLLVGGFAVAAFRTCRSTRGVSLAILILVLIRGITEVPLRPSGVGSGEMLLIMAMLLIWRMARAGDASVPAALVARPAWPAPTPPCLRPGRQAPTHGLVLCR